VVVALLPQWFTDVSKNEITSHSTAPIPASHPRRAPRTKNMLLPLNEATRKKISTANYLALEMARIGTMEPFHAIVIDEAIFLVRVMKGQDRGTDMDSLLADAIAAFERCRDAVTEIGVFRVDDVTYVTDRRYGAIPGSAYWRHQMIGA
jgi:hypothetical protein